PGSSSLSLNVASSLSRCSRAVIVTSPPIIAERSSIMSSRWALSLPSSSSGVRVDMAFSSAVSVPVHQRDRGGPTRGNNRFVRKLTRSTIRRATMADPVEVPRLETRDVRDRLILALYAQLKAERQTREALEYVIRNGALAPEVLEAIASDPVPVASADD